MVSFVDNRPHTYSFSFTPDNVERMGNGNMIVRGVSIERKKREYRHTNPSKYKQHKKRRK